MTESLEGHKVVSESEWIEARKSLLKKEKEFTALHDQLNQQRRELPWKAVNKEYLFEGPKGKETLAELFDERSQLVVYHFMFDPSWEEGCLHCSFWADNFNKIIVHLNQRDVTMIAVSRAPYSKLTAYENRMGWDFKWVSSYDSDFNFDYNVSFTPEQLDKKEASYNYKLQATPGAEREGVSVFYKDPAGRVFHTYSAYARGIDMLNVAYHYLDLVPKGRDEEGHEFPQFWVRRHDEYGKPLKTIKTDPVPTSWYRINSRSS
jgi:predicted dithiol-disulfide oxidoreductase (DUF899 family)